jgi:hypothetical protein
MSAEEKPFGTNAPSGCALVLCVDSKYAVRVLTTNRAEDTIAN